MRDVGARYQAIEAATAALSKLTRESVRANAANFHLFGRQVFQRLGFGIGLLLGLPLKPRSAVAAIRNFRKEFAATVDPGPGCYFEPPEDSLHVSVGTIVPFEPRFGPETFAHHKTAFHRFRSQAATIGSVEIDLAGVCLTSDGTLIAKGFPTEAFWNLTRLLRECFPQATAKKIANVTLGRFIRPVPATRLSELLNFIRRYRDKNFGRLSFHVAKWVEHNDAYSTIRRVRSTSLLAGHSELKS